MDSIIYQVLHPWHWLTYGQNATAVGVLVAIAGLAGLYNYVRDTRRIMELQEATARANITPILVARSDVEFVPSEVDCPEGADIGLVQRNIVAYEGALTIRNIGAGAALFLTGWCQPVSEKFVWDNPALLEKTTLSQDGIVPLTELVKDETTQVAFSGFKTR